jgi:uncharacterized membrane protein (DUF373 family)
MQDLLVSSLHMFGKSAAACQTSFFGIPAWYRYLTLDNKCDIVDFQVPGDLILVVVAFIDILLHLAGIAAIIFVVYGGIQYVTSQGNPDATAKAQSTIVNALIGLALAIVAIGFVAYFGNKLK